MALCPGWQCVPVFLDWVFLEEPVTKREIPRTSPSTDLSTELAAWQGQTVMTTPIHRRGGGMLYMEEVYAPNSPVWISLNPHVLPQPSGCADSRVLSL